MARKFLHSIFSTLTNGSNEFKAFKDIIPGLLLLHPHRSFDGRIIGAFENELIMNGQKIEFRREEVAIRTKWDLIEPRYWLFGRQRRLISVQSGSIFSITVDLRQYSPTCREAFCVELNSRNSFNLWVPEGFAFGYLTLEDQTKVRQLYTELDAFSQRRALVWNDVQLLHLWPTYSEAQVLESYCLRSSLKQAQLFEGFNQ